MKMVLLLPANVDLKKSLVFVFHSWEGPKVVKMRRPRHSFQLGCGLVTAGKSHENSLSMPHQQPTALLCPVISVWESLVALLPQQH